MVTTALTACSVIDRLRRSEAGRLFVAIAALMLLMQALPGVASASAHAMHMRDASPRYLADHCGATSGDPSSPVERRGDHADCCVFCDGSAAPPFNLSANVASIRTSLARPRPNARAAHKTIDQKPYGFLTSWSSQAPPQSV